MPGIYNNVLTVLKFIQGDKEVEMELPISPLCDRKNTMISESQIGMVIFLSHLRIREFTFSEVFFKTKTKLLFETGYFDNKRMFNLSHFDVRT